MLPLSPTMAGLLQNEHRQARPAPTNVRRESVQSWQMLFPQQSFVAPFTPIKNGSEQKAQASGSSLVDVMPLSDIGGLEAGGGDDAIARGTVQLRWEAPDRARRMPLI
mmetsp:Transcript_31855/g.68964  ORF Transcript_31855/g.68964 Transcript_31855/m.68964 type:complete len:108 (+) Transcript_31855:160-483(+)